MPNFRTVHCLPCIVHGQPCTSIFRHHLSPTPSTITRRMKRAMRGVRRWCLWGLELLDFTTYRRTRNRNQYYQTSSILPLTSVMITRDPIQKDFNFITVSRIHYTVGTSRDPNKATLNFWLDDLKVQKNIYAVQPRSQFLLSRPSTVQGCIWELLSMQRFLATDGNKRCAVFVFNFSSHNHITVVKSLFTSRYDQFENLGETTVLACEMFTSGVCDNRRPRTSFSYSSKFVCKFLSFAHFLKTFLHHSVLLFVFSFSLLSFNSSIYSSLTISKRDAIVVEKQLLE